MWLMAVQLSLHEEIKSFVVALEQGWFPLLLMVSICCGRIYTPLANIAGVPKVILNWQKRALAAGAELEAELQRRIMEAKRALIARR